jgi:NhaP-type Na+/H+ or K+/H+ antiporter
LSLRSVERHHDYNQRLHEFTEQLERLLMMVVLVLFGGAIARGLLAELDVDAILFTAAAILLVRPLAAWVGLIGLPGSRLERG